MSLHDGPKLLQTCDNCPIHNRAICAQCDADELHLLEDMKYYRSFDAGQTVIWAGDSMDFVASVVTGVATLTRVMGDGRTQMVGLLLPSDFVGRPGRETTPYNVTAITDLRMCCFRKKQFEAMMDRTPHIAHRLLAMTLDELDASREWMLLLGRKTAREKIASLLAIIARRDADLAAPKKTKGLTFDLPLTRAAMADYLGLTLETVSRQISALRGDGIIVLEGLRHVIVPDLGSLLAAAGEDDFAGMPV